MKKTLSFAIADERKNSHTIYVNSRIFDAFQEEEKIPDEARSIFNCGNVLIVPYHLSSLVMFSNDFRPVFFFFFVSIVGCIIRDFISHSHSTTF